MRFIQNETQYYLYAGAYTMFNTHEIACISGLAAAHHLELIIHLKMIG